MEEQCEDGPTGEDVCEGHGFDPSQCEMAGCCHWNPTMNECFSDVGADCCGEPETTGPPSGHPTGLPVTTVSPTGQPTALPECATGTDLCEGHGYDSDQCAAVGCCTFGGGNCYSMVGDTCCHVTPGYCTGGNLACEVSVPLYEEEQCNAVGCCRMSTSSGTCYSLVGNDCCDGSTRRLQAGGEHDIEVGDFWVSNKCVNW